jgi:hypothetical protein
MKFQASVVFELKAGSIAEAGQRLDQLLKHAEGHHEVPARMPGPQAEGLEGLSSGNRSGSSTGVSGLSRRMRIQRLRQWACSTTPRESPAPAARSRSSSSWLPARAERSRDVPR